MANFEKAYHDVIQPNEGGYVNNPNDKGGETYAGIARKFNPNWTGWTYIDFKKKTSGTIKRNTKFPDIEYLVIEFYKNRWNGLRLDEIKNQKVAEFIFDFHVHSQTTGIKILQKVLGIKQDGKIGNQTITAINAANQSRLLNDLIEARKTFLKSLAEKDPTQETFLDGWLSRVDGFKNPIASFGIIVVAGILYLLTR